MAVGWTMAPANPQPGRVIDRGLSPREREVLALIALGYSNAEVGVILYVSGETIKSHVRHILRKLDATTRAEAVYRAIQLGWLTTPSPDEWMRRSLASTPIPDVPWNGEPDALLRNLGRD